MGIFDFFAKKENTKGTTASQTQGGQQGTGFSQSNLWPQLGGYFDNFAATAFTPQGPNQYQTGAAEQQAGLGQMLAPAFQSAWNVAGQGIQDADINRFSNQYDTSVINNMIADYAKQNQQTLDAGRGRQAAQGALGNRTGADALILQGQQGAQADAIMKARQGGFNTATGLARDNAALQLQGAGQLGQLGSVASGINQAGFGMGQQLWQNPFMQFGQVSSAISPWAQASGQNTNYNGTSWGNTTGQTNQTTTKQPSPWEILTGVVGTGMAMFSDARIKEGVDGGPPEEIGQTHDGLPLYLYTKLGSRQPEVGPIAQDVQERHPEAVGEIGGVLTVDYPRALRPKPREEGFAFGGGVGGLMSLPGMGGAMDLMKEKGLPSGGVMEGTGIDLGTLGRMAGGFGLPMGFNAGGKVGGSSFADKVKAAHAVVKEMQAGGKVERPGFAFGGWEPTLTMGSMSPGDADAMVGTASSNQWGHDFKKWGDALAGSKIGSDDDKGVGSGGNSAMDALNQSQVRLGQFVAAADPRQHLPRMALGGVPGMYAGGDPDAAAAYDDDGYDMVPFGTTLDYEPSYVAPKGSPYGGALPGFAARPAFMDPTPPAAPPEVAGARYDAPMPPPRYQPDAPREGASGFMSGLKRLFSGDSGGAKDLVANSAWSETPNWGGRVGRSLMHGSSITRGISEGIGELAKEDMARKRALIEYAQLTGQLPATMGGGETLAARQLAENQRLHNAQIRASNVGADINEQKLDDLKNPMRVYDRREQVADRLGLKPGTRERSEFIATGDFPRANKDSLAVQAAEREVEAKRLGLKEGSPAYQAYVLTGKMPREDQQPLTATDKKAIMESEELALAGTDSILALKQALKLSPNINTGLTAGVRTWAGDTLHDYMVPDFLSSPTSAKDTVNFDNLVLGQALSNLKATFGAAPTEGERKILVDLQASKDKSVAARKEILERAVAAAERRVKFHDQRARELRGGTYYKPEHQPAIPGEGGKPIVKMTMEELQKLDKSTLTPEQLKEAAKRYNELQMPQP